MAYAEKTSVPVDRSMGQIRSLLSKEGADGVAIAEIKSGAAVQFVFEGKGYKFPIYYPTGTEDHILYTKTGQARTENQIEKEVDAEKRRLWRAMVLFIKAAIEAHRNGVIELQRSLVANLLLPSGKTAYEVISSNIDKIEVDSRFLLN